MGTRCKVLGRRGCGWRGIPACHWENFPPPLCWAPALPPPSADCKPTNHAACLTHEPEEIHFQRPTKHNLIWLLYQWKPRLFSGCLHTKTHFTHCPLFASNTHASLSCLSDSLRQPRINPSHMHGSIQIHDSFLLVIFSFFQIRTGFTGYTEFPCLHGKYWVS